MSFYTNFQFINDMKTLWFPILMALGTCVPAQAGPDFRSIIKIPADSQFTSASVDLTEAVQKAAWWMAQYLVDQAHRPPVDQLTVKLADVPDNIAPAEKPPGDCVRFIWTKNNCVYQMDYMMAASVLTVRPILGPGENLYDRIKGIVPECIRRFGRESKFGGITWPSNWVSAHFFKVGDLTDKARHWSDRLEMEMMDNGLRIYLPYWGHQRYPSWNDANRHFALTRLAFQKELEDPPFAPLDPEN
jgi:hypothetical protein